MLEVLRLRLYLMPQLFYFYTTVLLCGDGGEGSREDSLKGKMKLSGRSVSLAGRGTLALS